MSDSSEVKESSLKVDTKEFVPAKSLNPAASEWKPNPQASEFKPGQKIASIPANVPRPPIQQAMPPHFFNQNQMRMMGPGAEFIPGGAPAMIIPNGFNPYMQYGAPMPVLYPAPYGQQFFPPGMQQPPANMIPPKNGGNAYVNNGMNKGPRQRNNFPNAPMPQTDGPGNNDHLSPDESLPREDKVAMETPIPVENTAPVIVAEEVVVEEKRIENPVSVSSNVADAVPSIIKDFKKAVEVEKDSDSLKGSVVGAVKNSGDRDGGVVDSSSGNGNGPVHNSASSPRGSQAGAGSGWRGAKSQGGPMNRENSGGRGGGPMRPGGDSDIGWKRGEVMSIMDRNDGVVRYDKNKLLALFPLHKEKVCPEEIINKYPAHMIRDHMPCNKVPDSEITDIVFAKSKSKESEDTSSPEYLFKKGKEYFNKLSLENFERILEKFLSLGLEKEESLFDKVIELIVSNAQLQPTFCNMYASFCRRLMDTWSVSDEQLGVKFREKLLERCETEFSQDREAGFDKIRQQEDISEEDKEEKMYVLKLRYVGHMHFIGEIYRQDLVSASIMRKCIEQLMASTEEEKLACVCKLFQVLGKKLEEYYTEKKKKSKVNSYFESMVKMSEETGKYSSRIRFMFKDLIELRNSGWAGRNEPEKAQKLSDLRSGGTPKEGITPKSQDARAAVVTEPDGWNTVVNSKTKKSTAMPGPSALGRTKSGDITPRGMSGKSGPSGKVSVPGGSQDIRRGNGTSRMGERDGGRGLDSMRSRSGASAGAGAGRGGDTRSPRGFTGNMGASPAQGGRKNDRAPGNRGGPSASAETGEGIESLKINTSDSADYDMCDVSPRAEADSLQPGYGGEPVPKDSLRRVRAAVEEYFVNGMETELVEVLAELVHPGILLSY